MSEVAGASPGKKLGRRRSSILYEIAALIVVFFIIFGVVAFVLFRASENRIIDRSIDKLRATEAENISSSFIYIMKQQEPEYAIKGTEEGGMQAIFEALINKQPYPLQYEASDFLAEMIDSGMLGIDLSMLVLANLRSVLEPMIFASSDPSLIFNWTVPDWLTEAINDGVPYLWMEDGIPELGLNGTYLVVISPMDLPEYMVTAAFVGFKPMQEEIDSITSFYNQDKRNTTILFLVILACFLVFIVILTFVLLSRLIHKRITAPIDELSAAAEQVLDGDLDVRIDVRQGEEFEPLKRAFKSMVEEWRRLFEKSVSDETHDEGEG